MTREIQDAYIVLINILKENYRIDLNVEFRKRYCITILIDQPSKTLA